MSTPRGRAGFAGFTRWLMALLPRRRPRNRRGRRALTFVSALALAVGMSTAAVTTAHASTPAPKTSTSRATGSVAAAAPAADPTTSLSGDQSGTVPSFIPRGAASDYLGEGHDQVAYYDDAGHLDIAEPAKYGGKVLRSTPTDLMPTPLNPPYQPAVPLGSGNWIVYENDQVGPYAPNDLYTEDGQNFDLHDVQVAAGPDAIYMAGASYDTSDGDSKMVTDGYTLWLYKLPADGSCAQASCALAKYRLPNLFQHTGTHLRSSLIVVNSLAVRQVDGHTLVAVGMSERGVMIFEADGNSLERLLTLGDMGPSDSDVVQTPVTALAFGPAPSSTNGTLVLAVGVLSTWEDMFTYRLGVSESGADLRLTEQTMQHAGSSSLVLSAAVVTIKGTLYAAYGWDNGMIQFTDITDSDTPFMARVTDGGDPPVGLTPFTPLGGSADTQDLAVGAWNQDAADAKVVGYVDGEMSVLKPTQGGFTGTDTEMQQWFPGYGAGRLTIHNTTNVPVTVQLYSSSTSASGCWLNADVTTTAGNVIASALPASTPATLAAGATSPTYFVGSLTGGSDGDCFPTRGDNPGFNRYAYLVVTPAGDPADERIIKFLVGDDDDALSIPQQVGASADPDHSASVLSTQLTGPAHAVGNGDWGAWTLTVSGGAGDGRVSTAPTVTGQQLTSAPIDPAAADPDPTAPDDPYRPVYRFDVSGAQWAQGSASDEVDTQVPAMVVQGLVGENWVTLGKLMPPTATRSAAGTSDSVVTLGPSSFYWQNPPGAAPVTQVQVGFGGSFSKPVTLSALQPPPTWSVTDPNRIAAIKVATGTGGALTPRADGVDESGMSEVLQDFNGKSLSLTDPRYNLIFYRDSLSRALITGLYQDGSNLYQTSGYNDYVAIEPDADAVSSTATSVGSTVSAGRVSLDRMPGGPTGHRRRPPSPRHHRRHHRGGKGGGGGGSGGGGGLGATGELHVEAVTTSPDQLNLTPELNDFGLADSTVGGDAIVITPESDALSIDPGSTAARGIAVDGNKSGPVTLAGPTPSAPAVYQAGAAKTGPQIGLLFASQATTSTSMLPLAPDHYNPAAQGAAPLVSTPLTVSADGGSASLTSTQLSAFWDSPDIDAWLVAAGQLMPATKVPVS